MATNSSLLIWAKSIAPHAEEDAVGDCRAGAEGQSRSGGSEKGARPNLVWIPIREKGKQMQISILTTGRFRARLERNEVSGDDLDF
eukprot:CAMPEP_0172588046 /NCGR_PEP_ID=MMETSP1068-20121228/7004_1 /TAXON_ID=35684 /ORGANISM="Pseudopedinella elastica, Strain CCMP716" /LENGTH=85 /DNA_ID=CAMNT_0013383257 /DNA_START=257 /DNA_END=514 /DNA_ORIENTATION=+